MLIITTETLPPNMKLAECFGIVEYTAPVQISNKGLIQSIVERKRNEHQDALDAFTNSAPEGTNVIYGVKISTAAAQFNNGTFLYMTFAGTAGRAERV